MASTSVNPQIVVVTGAAGYIATHIVKQLLEARHRVRGTVRSLQNEDKVKHLKRLCPGEQNNLELVEAELLEPEPWERAFKGATYVIHVASPLPKGMPDNEDEIIRPAVEGTLNILKACVAVKTVKRVVMTSSDEAVVPEKVGDRPVTEEDWASPDQGNAYLTSKTLAEKAAWKYIAELSVEDRIELVTINPTYVMGPILHGSYSTIMEIPKRILDPPVPLLPKINFNLVDVRDVAAAHIRALFVPEAAGHRHIISNTNMWADEIGRFYAAEFTSQGYNVAARHCPYFLLWISSFFDKTISMMLPVVGREVQFDNTRMKKVLGIEPRDVKESLLDMAYSMIDGGFIKKTTKYKGRLSDTNRGKTNVEHNKDEK